MIECLVYYKCEHTLLYSVFTLIVRVEQKLYLMSLCFLYKETYVYQSLMWLYTYTYSLTFCLPEDISKRVETC
jgi:hypothetical protein